MILFLSTDFSSLSLELYMLLASLALALLCWVYLFIKALHSHLRTIFLSVGSSVGNTTSRFFCIPSQLPF